MRLGSDHFTRGLRETRSVPDGVDSPELLESFLTALAEKLAPGLEASVQAVECSEGVEAGTEWSAQGHLRDGTLIVVAVRARERTLTLLVDEPLSKPALPLVGRWTYLGVGGILTLGFAAGTWTESALSGTLVSASVLVGWVALEIHLLRRRERAALVRPLDVESWQRRFDAAIAFAEARVVTSSSPA
jgi:hypothetical protein